MTNPTPELVRPRIRRDVAFLETLDGVYVRGTDNAFVVRGASAYRYLSALLPHLNGTTLLTDIVAGLPEANAEAVRSLLGTLASRGVVTDGPDPLGRHDPSTVARYGGQLALLDHYGDDGHGFTRAAAARVLVVGDSAAAALADNLTANGIGSGDGDVSVSTLPAVADEIAGADVVSLVATDLPATHLFSLADACRAHDVAFLPLFRCGEVIVVGPWQPGDGGLDVYSAMLRMSDNAIEGVADVWQAATAGPMSAPPRSSLPGTTVSVALGIAAFEAFKTLTGTLNSDLADGVVIVEPDRLTVTAERLVAHPASPLYSPSPSAADAESDDTESPVERAYRRFEPVVADTVGMARKFDDDSAVQIPVKVASLVAPVIDRAPIVNFSSETTLEARLTALQTMAGRYALNVHRRRADLLAQPHETAEAIGTNQLDSWLGIPVAAPSSARAVDIATGGTVAVERAAILAGPWDRQAASFEPVLTGLAAAEARDQALTRAVVDAVGASTVTAIARGEVTIHPVSPELAAADPDQDRHKRLAMLVDELHNTGSRATLYAADGPAPVAVVHIGGPGEQVVARSGRSWPDAACDALLSVLGARQVAGTSLQLAEQRAGAETDLGSVIAGQAVADASHLHRTTTADDIAATLRTSGRRAAAVDLTTPDLDGVTAVVRVLLFRAPR